MHRPMVPLRFLAVLVLLVSVPLFATISYPPPTILTGGSGPSSVAVADFNNDCAADFATADQFANSVTVRFGDGSGGFAASSTITGLVTPMVIVSADFNGDGAPDLAVGNSAGFSADPVGHTITILLNNNDGSGTFTALPPASSPATNGFVTRLVAADVNEDGKIDLLAVDANSSPNGVRYYAGDGTGHFAAAAVISSDTHTPGSLVAVDLNGDHHLDLAVTMGDSTGIFLGNGNGTFGAPTYLPYTDTLNGDGAVHIAAADIDHDGDIDLVTTAGNYPGGVTVFRNNGNATFTRDRFKINSVVTDPIFVALADLDGDGNIDIVTANQFGCTPDGSNLSARPGNGDGTFGAIVPISVGYGPTCINSHWQPNAIAAIDLNCDGAADLIVPNMNTSFTSVLLTAGASDTTAPVVTAPPAVSVPAGPSCNAVVTDAQLGHASATDNCSSCIVIVRTGVPAGNIFPVGTTNVTYTASDGHGNSAAAIQHVTVTDNNPPAITAPADITVSTGATCSAIVNPGTPVASGPCTGVTVTSVRSDGQPLSAPFPLGTTTITWTATDAANNSASAIQTITVVAPPLVIGGGTANPSSLWPPTHKMVPVTVSYSTSGGCGGVNCAITSVTSNEPVDGLGDGDMSPDWQIVDAHHLNLRAERSGTGTGRIYTITITCTDGGGHTTMKSVNVTVPMAQN
ncbi:MAG TPA: FG-GAP-like repeat-containing protein [Thermoanaerobaculia bacterium]|nr:FG-GAP-like repeat-containing protein [Thermoanaerobaculia bacterium]